MGLVQNSTNLLPKRCKTSSRDAGVIGRTNDQRSVKYLTKFQVTCHFDEEEIQDYLCMLSESKKEKQPNENKKKQEKITKLEQELDELKSKLKMCQEKCKNNEMLDEFLYSGIFQFLVTKNPKN